MRKQSKVYRPLSKRPKLKKGVQDYMANKIVNPRTIEKLFSALLSTNCIRECKPVMKEDAQLFLDRDVLDREGRVLNQI